MNNGRRYSSTIRINAVSLRKGGKTHREIAASLGVSISTAHSWTKGIQLTNNQKRLLENRRNKSFRKKFLEYRHKNQRIFNERLENNFAVSWNGKYSKEDLIFNIKDFYRRNGRIPFKHELGNAYTFRRHFGTWNEAIVASGFTPNPVKFSKKFIAKDGHRCDSLSEKIIDNWLFSKGVAHERCVSYGSTGMTADFLIDGVFVEFFGLSGTVKKYDILVERKRTFCKKERIELLEIYRSPDLFKDADGYLTSAFRRVLQKERI